MTQLELNVAVCGCGPAGLAAAVLLQRCGHRVRLFERFEAAQPVGSGLILQPPGLAVLSELGAIHDLVELGAPIERLFGRVLPSHRVVLDVRYQSVGAGWQGLAVHRSALFDVLYNKVLSHGIPITCGVSVAGVRPKTAKAILYDAQERSLGEFDLIVDAMGANSPLTAGVVRKLLPYGALWANVPWPSHGNFLANALEQRYRRADRMAGILPIGRQHAAGPRLAAFFWSLRRDQLPRWQCADLAVWKAEVVQLWPEAQPLIEGISDPAQLTFARYEHFTRERAFSAGVAHVGDSARATSPQLGQGANMALLDALALANALRRSSTLEEALLDYGRMRYWHTRLYQWASATFTPFYQSDSRALPWVRDWLAAPLSRAPMLSRLLAHLVSGTLCPPLGLHSDFKAYRVRSTT